MNATAPDFRQAFLNFSLAQGVLKFGSFVTKSGRNTPYFFNSGLFNDGESLRPVSYTHLTLPTNREV